MKKIFLSTIVLFSFSAAMILFQLSCKKDAVAYDNVNGYVLPVATPTTLGGVKPDGTTITVDATGKISAATPQNGANSAALIVYSKRGSGGQTEIWKIKTDGTGNQKINIVLPATSELDVNDGGAFKLNATATKIVFQARNKTTDKGELYTCNVDGSAVTKLLDGLDELQLGDFN